MPPRDDEVQALVEHRHRRVDDRVRVQ